MSPDPDQPLRELEDALEVFLAESEGATDDARREAVLREHPELREVLEPMLRADELPEVGETPGDTLQDYRMVREIGRGGMGVVHEATQLSLKRSINTSQRKAFSKR